MSFKSDAINDFASEENKSKSKYTRPTSDGHTSSEKIAKTSAVNLNGSEPAV
jgi:hypothetical protein